MKKFIYVLHSTPLIALLIANLWWGLSPIYWHELAAISPWFVVSMRVLSSRIVLQFFSVDCSQTVRKEKWHLSAVTAFLIIINWSLYIYAVLNGETIQASLGYFLLPLLSVAFAAFWYRENLSSTDLISISLATVGVAFIAVRGEGFPFIALGLAVSILLYSAIYRSYGLSPVRGLRMETTLLSPFAFAYMIWNWSDVAPQLSAPLLILLLVSGLVTTIPMYLYLTALPKLDFAVSGFFQFIVPMTKLIVAVTVLHEVISHEELLSFSLILTAIALFLVGRYGAQLISSARKRIYT